MIIFDRFGAQRISLKEFQAEWEQPYMLFYAKYLPKLTKKEQDAMYDDAYRAAIAKYPPVAYSGIKNVLKQFQQDGIKMIVISSDFLRDVNKEIEAYSLQGIFSEINADVYDKAETIHEIIAKNQIAPEETLFIGDTVHEIEAGKSAGTKTAAVTWGFQDAEKLRAAHPDYLIKSIKELEHTVSEVAERD